jgi:hypothetical protein
LVDKTALPEWLREAGQSESAPARPVGGNPSISQRPFEAVLASDETLRAAARSDTGNFPTVLSATPSPFDAADLVDEKGLPDWLRSSSETEPLPLPFSVSHSVSSLSREHSAERSTTLAGGGGADDDAVPDWLQQVYSDAQVPPLHIDSPPLSAGPKQISGSDLLDGRSVPTWLQEAAQTSPLANISDILAFTPPADQPSNPPHAGEQRLSLSSASGSGAEPVSANSLIDANSLPDWMRKLDDDSLLKGTSGSGFAAEASQDGAPDFYSASELVDTRALPTWMKAQESPTGSEVSTQSMDQSASSGSASDFYSASELVDTHALPTWMKGQEPAQASESFAGQAQSAPLGSASGIISAAELVNTQALPAWLKAQEPPAAPTPDTSAGSPGQSAPLGSASGIIAASELVDTAALPAWMKGQEPVASPASGVPSASSAFEAVRPPSSKMTPMPVGFAKESTGAFSAAELVDTKALPAWLKNVGSDVGSSTSQGGLNASSASAGPIIGSELVDTGALPVWLRGAESSPGTSDSFAASAFPTPRGTGPTESSDQTGGFSAASLVDPEALPEWLRPAQSGALSQSGALERSGSGADWGESDPTEQRGMSAASLINPTDLPEWMQSQEGMQRPGSQFMEGAGDEDTPQARVPRRPRLSTEPDRAPSQAAASVFSSVLGPTAGEDQRSSSSLVGRFSASHEMPALDRSNPFGQLNAQAQEQGWEDVGPSGWNQPPLSPRGEFDQNSPGAPGEWSGSFGGQGMPGELPPERQRPGYRPLGPLSEGQRSRQAGRPQTNPEYDKPGGQGPEPYGQRGFGEYPPGQQGRGAPGRGGYQQQYDDWKGGPEYDPGFAGDDEAGPPSGMFAKLKRVLGFGR